MFLSNIGVQLPGKTFAFGIGIMLGKAAGSPWQPMVAAMTACFLGGICSFWLGRRLGHVGVAKTHWLHLTPERLKWPQQFFKQYGAKSVFIARFIPLLPPVATWGISGGTMANRYHLLLVAVDPTSQAYHKELKLIHFCIR